MSTHPAPGGILGLDLGSVVGFAYGRAEQRHARLWHRIIRVGNELSGKSFGRYHDLIDATLAELRPERVVAEAPLRAAAMNHDHAMLQQIGLTAFTLESCVRHSVPYHAMGLDDVRTAIIGKSRWPKGEVKREVLAWARKDGYAAANTHEADAAAVWTAFAREVRRGRRISEARLIGEAALDVGLLAEALDEDDDDG